MARRGTGEGATARRWVVVLGGAVVTAVTGCSHGSAATSAYDMPPRPVRIGETPLPAHPVRDGAITFTAIGLRDKMSTVVGSHADWPARGRFVRVRVVIDNGYPTFHTLDLTRQLLVTADGATYAIDENATRIERQPTSLLIGGHDRVELDLLYDIPKSATLRALRFYGAPVSDLGLPLDDRGVEVALP